MSSLWQRRPPHYRCKWYPASHIAIVTWQRREMMHLMHGLLITDADCSLSYAFIFTFFSHPNQHLGAAKISIICITVPWSTHDSLQSLSCSAVWCVARRGDHLTFLWPGTQPPTPRPVLGTRETGLVRTGRWRKSHLWANLELWSDQSDNVAQRDLQWLTVIVASHVSLQYCL